MVSLIGNRAVKTATFANPKYVGDPVNTVALFSSFEAEELIVLDISESFGQPKADTKMLSEIIENAEMPIAFGGGIRKYGDAQELFELGFDKVIMRRGLEDPQLVTKISSNYGAQAVSGCLDFIWHESRSDEIEINARPFSTDSLSNFLAKLPEFGLGELIIQDKSADGLRSGLRSSPLLELAIDTLDIPVVALGGCKNVEDAAQFILQTGCHSVAASTTFLFRPSRDAVLINYPSVDSWHRNFVRS